MTLDRLTIVKIGGGANINHEGIVVDIAQMNVPVIVVVGANATRDRLAEQLGMPKTVITSVSGYDSVYSDEAAIDLIMMSYAGLTRNRLVERFHKHGVNAIGLSGMDGGLIQGTRNRGIRVRENGKTLIKQDLSGKPKRLNVEFLKHLLNSGCLPVLCIPIQDEDGFAINADNDNIVNLLHAELGSERICQFIEAPGLLADRSDPSSLIPNIDAMNLADYEHVAEGRMKRKLLAIRKLFESGKTHLVIADGRSEHPLLDAVAGSGTHIN